MQELDILMTTLRKGISGSHIISSKLNWNEESRENDLVG